MISRWSVNADAERKFQACQSHNPKNKEQFIDGTIEGNSVKGIPRTFKDFVFVLTEICLTKMFISLLIYCDEMETLANPYFILPYFCLKLLKSMKLWALISHSSFPGRYSSCISLARACPPLYIWQPPPPGAICYTRPLTCNMVKFSRTLFIMYFSGRCFSLWMKLIMYSHIGDRWILYTNRPFSNLAYSVCW